MKGNYKIMEDRRDAIISYATLLAASLSYPLICFWYVGVPLAILSVVLWIYQRKHYEPNRVANVGGVLGAIMVGTVLLTVIIFAIYFGAISAENRINWQEILLDVNLFQEEG